MRGHENRYNNFDILKDVTDLKLIYNGDPIVEYHKMVQTGDLDFYDYGIGFLNFEIRSFRIGDHWVVRIWIASIDDGDLGAWSAPMSEAEAEKLVRRVATEYLVNLKVFPTLDKLNEDLKPYGLNIVFE